MTSARYGWSESLRRVAALLVLGVLWAPLPSQADGWQAVPLYGADVRSLAFDPQVAGRVLAGTSAGQVYESLDAGVGWRPVGQRVALPGWVVSDLVFDRHRPGEVWAAVWSLWGSAGNVLLSQDGGRTWSERGRGLTDSQVYTLALVPDRPESLFAATRDGVWMSEDRGLSWRHATASLPALGKVTSLLIDPYEPAIVYAGSWRRAYRSDDRGATWNGIFDGMVLDSEVFSLVPGPGGEGDLWASTCGWVYHGSDRGGRWVRHTNGLTERRTPSFDVLPGGRLLAGTVAGVFGSDDRGASWNRSGAQVAVTTVVHDPKRPELVLHGSEGAGVWRSTDGGRSFVPSATGMVGLRISDVVGHRGGVSLSVRNSEGRDGVHLLSTAGLNSLAGSELPEVLDLASDGEGLLAGTEAGLWRFRGGEWTEVGDVGGRRLDGVWAGAGRWVAHDRTTVLANLGGDTYSASFPGPISSAFEWKGAVWIVEGGRLHRWDLASPEPVTTPGAVRTVVANPAALVLDTGKGLYRFDGEIWRPLPFQVTRLLDTGDAAWPTLAIDRDGSATLHDATGRSGARLLLPVPWREVSAALLQEGRLHLATAGYGLLWSQLLTLDDRANGAAVDAVSP